MIHGSTFVEQQVRQMLNSASCDVECWNMSFNMSKAVERCWTKIKLGPIPFNKLPASCHLLNDVNQLLVFRFVSRGLVERSNMAGWRLGCVRSVMAGLFFGWWLCFVSSSPGLANDFTSVSNLGSSFKDLKSMLMKISVNYVIRRLFAGVLPTELHLKVNCKCPVRNFIFIAISSWIFFVLLFFAQHQRSQHRAITTFPRPPFSKYGVVAQQKLNEYSTSRNLVQQLLLNKIRTLLNGVSFA